tara:strand:+ start:1175 stop:1435 length:261 start_codon:yes stop_codon:yes gene_type:complete
MDIEKAAKREVDRIGKIMPNVILLESQGSALVSFAKDYAKDAKFFFEHGKFVEAFEAAIISWAYIDISLKLKLIKVNAKFLKHFTS